MSVVFKKEGGKKACKIPKNILYFNKFVQGIKIQKRISIRKS